MEFLTEEQIREVTWEVINTFLIPDFEARGHNASGQWKENLGVRVEDNESVITGTDYTEYLIRGRGPNVNQDPKAISNWARWYGKNVFSQWTDNKGLGLNPYAVAYTIAREGTKTFREGGSDFLKILESDEVKRFLVERLSIFIKVNIQNTLRDSLDKLKKA